MIFAENVMGIIVFWPVAKSKPSHPLRGYGQRLQINQILPDPSGIRKNACKIFLIVDGRVVLGMGYYLFAHR